MKPLQAFLLDDEPPALRRLSIALGAIEDVAVVGASTSARNSIGLIDALRPDVLFIDVSMPSHDGFDVVEKLDPGHMPAVVFVTAYDAHAVRAFGVGAVDYLLKPVAPDRLKLAVARARSVVNARGRAEPTKHLRQSLAEPDPRPAYRTELWANRQRQHVRIPLSTLEWIEAERDYLRLHMSEGQAFLRMTIARLEEELDPDQFVRVHRSAICRKSAIVSLRRKRTGALLVSLAGGDEVPVGRSYAKGLRQLLAQVRAER